MNDAGTCLRVAVLGDSSATLYTQEDPFERSRADGARPWPELLENYAAPGAMCVSLLAGVGQQLADGLAGNYEVLDRLAPQLVLVSHGGREGVVGLPRALGWLRCYAHNEAPYRGRHRVRQLIRRPIWAALVRLVDTWPRLARAVLRLANVHAVRADVDGYRADLDRTVSQLVERGAHVVLMPSYIGFQSYWPVFRDIVAANDRTATEIARRYDGKVSVVTLIDHLGESDFASDGAHLSIEGHRHAAELVWAHLAANVSGLLPPLPSQLANGEQARTRAAVA